MVDFYGTGIEICAGFGPVGITEKTFSIVSCSFRDTSPRDFFIMTLNVN